jgi:hypothetical protein
MKIGRVALMGDKLNAFKIWFEYLQVEWFIIRVWCDGPSSLHLNDHNNDNNNSIPIYLNANLTAQRPVT